MKAIVLDTETTGLVNHPNAKLSTQPRMIEVGAVLLEWPSQRILRELELLVNPGVALEPIITKITGLTDEDLVDEPPFIELLPQIREFFVGADVLIAHNLPFDKAILHYELVRAGVIDFPWPRWELCTVQENEPAWGRRPKLIELYEAATGKIFMQKHRALDDVHKLTEIVIQERYLDFFPTTASAH